LFEGLGGSGLGARGSEIKNCHIPV
jgi:hypothetical protein